MTPLVSLAVAKDHLRILSADQDADLALKLDQATAIIVGYLDTQAVAGWTATPPTVDVPATVSAAALYVLEDLYERRPINWDIVRDLLVWFRDPALA